MSAPKIPDGAVIITSREIYDQVVTIGAKVDLLLEKDGADREHRRDHEKRLRSLERTRLVAPSSAVAAVGSLIAAWTTHR